MAMEGEPNVHRVWMPDEDTPGLAMARAFGDFCLKDYGVISTPQVFYRKLSERDEFVVLATDGVREHFPILLLQIPLLIPSFLRTCN